MATRRRSQEFGIKDYIQIGVLLMTIGGGLAKITGVQSDLDNLKSRYDREVVPRQEHLQMNSVTEERWNAMDRRLSSMETEMKDLNNQLRKR